MPPRHKKDLDSSSVILHSKSPSARSNLSIAPCPHISKTAKPNPNLLSSGNASENSSSILHAAANPKPFSLNGDYYKSSRDVSPAQKDKPTKRNELREILEQL